MNYTILVCIEHIYTCIKISARYNFMIWLLKCISNEERERGERKGEKAYFRKFIADILSRYPCLQNSETFSRGLCNARIKRVKLRTLVRWIHTVIDALNFRIYVSRSFRPLLLLVESWLATFVRYRKSRFSIIAKSREAQSWYSSCHSSKL